MLRITNDSGFHIVFENGYTVSVQFGKGNYCDYDFSSLSSPNAECAVWGEDGGFIEHPLFEGDSVGARMTPKEILELLVWAEAQPVGGAKK